VQQIATGSPATQGNVVHLGNARLTLPRGWYSEFEEPKGGSSNMMPTWCLSPTRLPIPTYVDQDCAASFSEAPAGIELSVDTVGGIVSNPEQCMAGHYATDELVSYADSMLGNRPADYRRWLFVCTDGKRWPIEQYVADNAQGFILVGQADPATRAALTSIAQSAVLPAMSGPLRLSDLGIVRTVTRLPSGAFSISLDRVVQGTNGLINNSTTTYQYDVPPPSGPGAQPPRVGALINVFTNGTTSTGYSILPN
jgi:hypothetical protein